MDNNLIDKLIKEVKIVDANDDVYKKPTFKLNEDEEKWVEERRGETFIYSSWGFLNKESLATVWGLHKRGDHLRLHVPLIKEPTITFVEFLKKKDAALRNGDILPPSESWFEVDPKKITFIKGGLKEIDKKIGIYFEETY